MGTKEKVLQALLQSFNSSVSGQELAQQCNVTRAAIWKAVSTLREEGCQIEGTTNGGYILTQKPDLFTPQAFIEQFSKDFPEYKNIYIECFKQIDSTNTYAKKLLSNQTTETNYAPGVIVAETQTQGRGRLGRTFVSPYKSGIYISIIYSPKGGITNPAIITASSAVAVCRSIKKLFGITPGIKWINDLFIDKKKVCGILTEGFTNFETGTIDSAIIGIGVNISQNTKDFSPELLSIVGSIQKETSVSRVELASQIAGQVLSILQEDSKSVIQEYKSMSFLIGKEVLVHPVIDQESSDYTAKVIDINSDASLVVSLPDGTRRVLNSGEVSLKSDFFTKN